MSSRPYRIEGCAIVSADGMLADASGVMPDALVFEADQQFFESKLEQAALLVHGRNSQENQHNSPRRRRLILTRSVASIAPDPDNPKALLWNPAGASFQEAWRAAGAPQGIVAVIGGTEGFGLFLEIGYDAFYLTRANHVRLPGGRPVFPDVPRRTPEAVLAEHGLQPGPPELLDPASGITLVRWTRKPDAEPTGYAR